jgi:hypothetical protein
MRMEVAYSRIKAAHITVGHATTVDDMMSLHVLARRLGDGLVYPIGLEPVFWRDEAKLNL